MDEDAVSRSVQGSSERTRRAQVISISSGKGGVGKSNVAANLGIALAKQGHRVCVIDADSSLANINILLGILPKLTLSDFLNGERSLAEITLKAPGGIHILPAASGVADHAELSPVQLQRLSKAFQALEQDYDYLIVDNAAGIGKGVRHFIHASHYAVLVVSTEPTSLTDAFALIKVLTQQGFRRPIYTIVNMATDFTEAMGQFKRFAGTVERFLHTRVSFLGYLPKDGEVLRAVRRQRPFVLETPECPASRNLLTMAHAIQRHFSHPGEDNSFLAYWEKLRYEEPDATQSKEIIDRRKHAEPNFALHEAIQWINSSDQTQARQFIELLMDRYNERFGELPLSLEDTIYRQLELKGFDARQIKHLIGALEALYEKQHQRPLHDLDESILRLFVTLDGSKEKMEHLAHELQEIYGKKFQQPLFGLRAVRTASQ